MSIEHSVLAMGAGKATGMHANIWNQFGWGVLAYDINPARLELETMQENFRAQFLAGHVAVLGSLQAVAFSPSIIDIATTSGFHTEALLDALDAVDTPPRAVLLEKPLDGFESLEALFREGSLDENKVFVNENYSASAALTHMMSLVEQEKRKGNGVKKVQVSFDKNRVPDVLAGRYTDKILGAYGIEVPHMLAVGLSLAGVSPTDELEQVENRYGLDVDGIEHSEYTYSRLQTPGGVDLVVAQGLGPFRMDQNGGRQAYDFQKGEAIRTARVRFSDGRTATATFAPVPGLNKEYHSKVVWEDANGKVQEAVHEDNTLKRVIRFTIDCAVSGQRPKFTEGLTVASGIQYTKQLALLRDGAQVIRG